MTHAQYLTAVREAVAGLNPNTVTTAYTGGTATVNTFNRAFKSIGTFSVNTNNIVFSASPVSTVIKTDLNGITNEIVSALKAFIDGTPTTMTINAQACHSSCHNNCHSSRGRR